MKDKTALTQKVHLLEQQLQVYEKKQSTESFKFALQFITEHGTAVLASKKCSNAELRFTLRHITEMAHATISQE